MWMVDLPSLLPPAEKVAFQEVCTSGQNTVYATLHVELAVASQEQCCLKPADLVDLWTLVYLVCVDFRVVHHYIDNRQNV